MMLCIKNRKDARTRVIVRIRASLSVFSVLGMPSAIFPAEPAVDFHGGGTTVGESAHHQ